MNFPQILVTEQIPSPQLKNHENSALSRSIRPMMVKAAEAMRA